MWFCLNLDRYNRFLLHDAKTNDVINKNKKFKLVFIYYFHLFVQQFRTKVIAKARWEVDFVVTNNLIKLKKENGSNLLWDGKLSRLEPNVILLALFWFEMGNDENSHL